jgi:hypothetical protein
MGAVRRVSRLVLKASLFWATSCLCEIAWTRLDRTMDSQGSPLFAGLSEAPGKD